MNPEGTTPPVVVSPSTPQPELFELRGYWLYPYACIISILLALLVMYNEVGNERLTTAPSISWPLVIGWAAWYFLVYLGRILILRDVQKKAGGIRRYHAGLFASLLPEIIVWFLAVAGFFGLLSVLQNTALNSADGNDYGPIFLGMGITVILFVGAGFQAIGMALSAQKVKKDYGGL